jgi:NADH-quinone oxidoreductase subunit L
MPEYSGPLQSVELSSSLWLIPLLPFLGALINALVGWRMQRAAAGRDLAKRLHIGSLPVSAVAMGSVGLAFLLSVGQVVRIVGLPHDRRFLYCHLWEMLRVGTLDASFDLSLDTVSSVMLLVVTGVGFLIHVYAGAYMQKEPSYWRFFSYLNLFIFAMLLLVLGDNFFVMFFGWEGVGLCSYLLIGFWYKDYKKATAGTKAFLTNRVGDFGFVGGMLVLLWALGGSWTAGGDYVPDQVPRLVAVTLEDAGHGAHGAGEHGSGHGEKAAEGGAHGAPVAAAAHDAGHGTPPIGAKAYLTFTAFPGAKLYANNDMQRPLGVAPFVRKQVDAQRHSFRVVMGGATEDLALDHVVFPAGKETMLAAVGPVASFRQLQNQFAIRDRQGHQPFRDGLAGKTLWGIGAITLACIGLFIGATGKSAQIPLYVWLPDAMAGPTPVSALIHAATMVTSGVYMVARLNFLFSLSPTASGIVACVGACTALFAASIGFFQYDIKKVLAYSTVSQLGFMFIGVGVGAYWAGVFHLMTHAFFKACLFLGSGSVIHGMHAVEHDADRAQDMRIMGGLKKVMPLTRWTYFVACLAITAAPVPLFAGFWSKDEILWRAFTTANTGWMPGWIVYGMGLTAAVGTSFYMWRSYFLTFEGKHATREIPDKVQESPAAMTWVLVILAFLSTVGGALFGFSSHFVGGHGEPLLESWMHPALRHARVSFHERGLGLEYALMALSVALAIAAFFAARKRYGAERPDDWEAIERRIPGFELIHQKYKVDELYGATVIRGTLGLRLVLRDMDRWVIDGLVDFAGAATKLTAWVNGAIDKYLVDGAVNLVAGATLRAGVWVRGLQTGRIQSYVFGLLGGVAALVLIQFLVRYYGAR